MAKDKIRVGIIGANANYGWGGRAHIPALKALPEYELVAVCTRSQATAEATARHYGIPLAFHDPAELVTHPEVDLVSVCVRVPVHYQMVAAAVNAGKHVYCEWPLGAGVVQTAQLRDLAESKRVGHMIGLQSRGSPVFNQVKELIASGYIGDVLSCTMIASRSGAGQRTADSAWSADRANGASTLSIVGGHTLDALCFCLGEFEELSAVVSTQVKQAVVKETGKTVDVTSPDNALINGVLQNGAAVSAHIKFVPYHHTGFTMEIHGTDGALVLKSDYLPMIGEVTLRGGRGSDKGLSEIPIKAKHRWVSEAVPANPALNVAQMFRKLSEAIWNGVPIEPDFNLAVKRHQLLDAIEKASASGERVKV